MIKRKNFDKNTKQKYYFCRTSCDKTESFVNSFVLIFVDFYFRSNHNQLFRYTTFNVPKILKGL